MLFRSEEAGVRVSVHQRVDLQLCVFKGVGRGVGHLLVDHLPHPRIQTHLERMGEGGGRKERSRRKEGRRGGWRRGRRGVGRGVSEGGKGEGRTEITHCSTLSMLLQ